MNSRRTINEAWWLILKSCHPRFIGDPGLNTPLKIKLCGSWDVIIMDLQASLKMTAPKGHLLAEYNHP